MRVVRLTTEEEGVALLAGAWLGGDKGVLLMQSSGVGNCINMLSLPLSCQFPLLMLVTMRGDHGEFNPSQVPMGNATQRVLEAIGVIVKRADTLEEIPEMVSGAMRLAFNTYRPVAVLIGQTGPGREGFPQAHRRRCDMSRLLHRRDVVRELLEGRGDLLVVAGLGAPAWDITATGDHPL